MEIKTVRPSTAYPYVASGKEKIVELNSAPPNSSIACKVVKIPDLKIPVTVSKRDDLLEKRMRERIARQSKFEYAHERVHNILMFYVYKIIRYRKRKARKY
jgi:hypothetical protein